MAEALDALRQARDTAERRLARLQTLIRLSRLVSASLDIDELLRGISRAAADLMDATIVGFWIVDESTRTLEMRGFSDERMGADYPLRRLGLDQGILGWVATHRRPLNVPDVFADGRIFAHDWFRAHGLKSALAVPIIDQDRVVGVLAMNRTVPFRLDADDQDLLDGFVAQAVVAIRNARVYGESETRRRRLAALVAVAQRLTRGLELPAVLDGIVEAAAEVFEGEAGIRLVEGDELVRVAATPAVRGAMARERLRLGESISGRVAVTGRPALVPDTSADPALLPEHRAAITPERTGALMCVPVRGGARVVGTLNIYRERGYRFDPDALELATSLADQAGIAIDNARLYAEVARRRREAEELARAARTLTESLDLGAVGEHIVRSVLPLCGAAAAGLRLLQPDGSFLAIASTAPAGSHGPPGHVQGPGVGMAALIVAEGRPVASPDILTDPRAVLSDELRERISATGLGASLGVPLRAKGRIIGTLFISDRTGRVFSEGEAHLLQAFGDQAAVAIENARLYEEAQRGRRAAEALAALTRDINASLDPDVILQRMVDVARELCQADLAHIALREDDSPDVTVRFRYWAGFRHRGPRPFAVKPGRGIGGQVLLTGRPFRTDDYGQDPRITKDYLPVIEEEGIRASMAVPIRLGSQIEGLLFVDSRTRTFTDQDEAMLVQLADHAAVAIQNARLFARADAARAEAEASARRFRELVEGLDAIVWEADASSSRFSFVSERARGILGYPVEQWLTEPGFWASHLHPDDRAGAAASWRQAVAERDDFELEYRMVAADGRAVWIRATVHVTRDPAGQPRQLRGLLVEVTERKEAERRLAVQYAATRTLTEAAGIATAVPGLLRTIGEGLEWDLAEFWLMDPAANALRCAEVWSVTDPAVASFVEATRRTSVAPGAGLVGRVWASGRPLWVADVSADPLFLLAPAAAAAGLHGAFGFPVRLGEYILGVVVALGRRVREPDPDLLAMLAAIGSQLGQFLERKQAEAAVRESEARKAAILETALDAVITIDHEGRVVEFNPAAERTFGYPRAAAVGRELAELIVPPALRGRHREGLARYLATGEGVLLGRRTELTAMRADGTEFPVELAVTRIPTAGPPLFTAYLRDIAQQKRLEAELRQAQKMEAIGRLAGGVAHDFNNVLAVILGHAELMLSVLGEGDPLRGDAEQIRRASDRAAALTHQLLAFSRRQLLQPRVLDLNALVVNVTTLLRRLIGEDVELVTHLAPTLGHVTADAGQLEQVLMNLAVNARDAMPGGGQLVIETGDVDLDPAGSAGPPGLAPGGYVRLAVRDTGCGMSAETQARVFEPFFTTKGPGKGTGLGLSTVYGIVQQHRGAVEVESEIGHGTTFTVYLPRTEEAPAARPRAAVPGATPLRGAETVLLAEDETAVRQLVREVLAQQGYAVLEAADGRDALALADRHPGHIDLLLTDVVMPLMSGRELAERLTRARPTTRVLYVSGYTDDALGPHGVLEPGTAFLQKPFAPEALLRKVREVLDA